MKTLEQSFNELTEVWRDLIFEIAYSIGIIWAIKRVKFLKLRSWVADRLAIK